jgi:[acyl-carrier-protein] S-malonyltransferase
MKLAFVFPGQGSQTVGMLNSFVDNATVQNTLRTADDLLKESLSGLIANGPVENLGLTENTQPAMLVASVGMYRAWLEIGGQQPELLAGHSLGEYSALVAAGVLSFEDAVPLVRFRARAMQSAVPVGIGGMAAVLGMEAAAVMQHCQAISKEGHVLEAVNFNAPDQTVIAGHTAAVAEAAEIMKAAGAKRVVILPVSAPFHASLLKPAADQLAVQMQGIHFNPPAIPVIHNVDCALKQSPDDIRAALSLQACSAVQWVKTIQTMSSMGVTHIVECGPGKVLAGLIKRIAPEITVMNIYDQKSLEQTQQILQST